MLGVFLRKLVIIRLVYRINSGFLLLFFVISTDACCVAALNKNTRAHYLNRLRCAYYTISLSAASSHCFIARNFYFAIVFPAHFLIVTCINIFSLFPVLLVAAKVL